MSLMQNREMMWAAGKWVLKACAIAALVVVCGLVFVAELAAGLDAAKTEALESRIDELVIENAKLEKQLSENRAVGRPAITPAERIQGQLDDLLDDICNRSPGLIHTLTMGDEGGSWRGPFYPEARCSRIGVRDLMGVTALRVEEDRLASGDFEGFGNLESLTLLLERKPPADLLPKAHVPSLKTLSLSWPGSCFGGTYRVKGVPRETIALGDSPGDYCGVIFGAH